MKHAKSRFCARRHTPADVARASGGLEALEPRVHLAAYTFESFHEFFNVPSTLHEIAAPEGAAAAGFGAAAAGLGDLDGDGKGEFAVSAPGSADTPEVAGRVFIYSGATGQLLRTLQDGSAEFGVSLANIGDIDDDGRPDLLVGSPLHGGTGAAYIFSGADGSILRTFTGPSAGAEFGRVVALVGGQDESPRVAVAAPGAGANGEGQVFVLTTAEVLPAIPGAEILFVLTGQGAGDRFGAAMATTLGSGGAEGVAANLLIGAPLNDAVGEDAGRAYLYSGEDGSLLLTLNGFLPGDHFGAAVGVTWSGTETELVVGAPLHDFTAPGGTEPVVDSGRVDFYNTAGEQIFDLPIWGGPGARVGTAITSLGDVNGDGFNDLVRFDPGRPVGERLQFMLSSHQFGGAITGNAVLGAGDVNGDGLSDLMFISGGGPEATTGNLATIVSSLIRFGGGAIIVTSDDLSNVIVSGVRVSPPVGINYGFLDGQLVALRMLPGVGPDGIVVLVNNAGLLVGRVEIPADEGGFRGANPFIVSDGERMMIEDLVTQIVGSDATPNWANMRPVALNEDGAIIFNETTTPSGDEGAGVRSWLYHDGVLTFLWNGPSIDINEAGQIIGSLTPDQANPVLRQPDGTIVPLTGMRNVAAISDNGVVAGLTSSGAPATWSDGTITELNEAFLPDNGVWIVLDVDNDGRVLARRTEFVGRGTFRTDYIFIPGEGPVAIPSAVFGGMAPGELLRLADGGRIVATSGVLVPIDERIVWSIGEGAPVATVATGGTTTIIGVNSLGDVIAFQDDTGTGGVTRRFRITTGFTGEPTDILAYVDPKDGEAYAFVLAGGIVSWGRITDGAWNGTPLSTFPGMETITDHATVFISPSGGVFLAGTDDAGDLILYFQTGVAPATGSFTWGSANLTVDHVEARGQTFVPVASDVTGFSTVWGTDHVAYLDEQGQIQIVWWAPGETLWRIDQLTMVESSGVLSGRPTSFVTPWSTLHINAFDAEGRTVAVWWAPGFGADWRTDPLAPDAPKLDPVTAAAFVTPWNAMNIFGFDAQTGELTVYWWAPQTGEWRVERVEAAGAPDDLSLTAPVAATVSPAGVQNIVARQSNGEVGRFIWTVSDGWIFENVTLAAVG